MNITISAKKTLMWLMTVNFFFLALHLVTRPWALNFYEHEYTFLALERVSLGAETSIPTWYNQFLLLTASLLLFAIAALKRNSKVRFVKLWYILAGIFLYLSVDEGSAIHELAVDPVQSAFGIHGGFLYYAWIIPALVLLAVMGGVYAKFWLQLPRKTRFIFVLALFIYIGGAVGFEMLAANYISQPGAVRTFYLELLVGFEEFFELMGVSIFIYALLVYIKQVIPKATLPTLQVRE